MTQTVISHNVVALYAEPNTASALASQLVLGTKVRLLGGRVPDVVSGASDAELVHVEGEDRYQGWVRADYIAEEEESFGDNPETTIATLIADVHSSPGGDSQILTKLTVATRVILDRHDSGRDFLPLLLPTGETGYTHRANLSSSYRSDSGEGGGLGDLDTQLPSASLLAKLRAQIVPRLVAHASESSLRFIGTPYLWGGTTPFGLDCSGLTQLCYKIAGIQLLRDAWMQMLDKRFTLVERDASLPDAHYTPGDLLFFHSRATSGESSLRRVAHVGIALGDGSFVHAAGQGRGVINTRCDDADWTSLYAGAARLSPDADLSIQSA